MGCGPFDPTKIRGVGVWKDKDSWVINGRDRIHSFDGEELVRGKFSSSFTYVTSTKPLTGRLQAPLTNSDSLQILNACQKFHFQEKGSPYFLAGWLAIARIAGSTAYTPASVDHRA